MVRKKEAAPNLMDLKPIRTADHENTTEERVVILRPKFQNRWLVKWLMPRMRRPFFRVRLDPLGSFVWLQCNGSITVWEIACRTQRKFADQAGKGDLEDRVAKFVLCLWRAGLVRVQDSDP